MPKMPSSIPITSLQFLSLLKMNNNRNWFNAHKAAFAEQQTLIESFATSLLAALNTHDVIETLSGKKSLHRIYRDTRFSNNKTPYKTNWSGSFTRASKARRGGYYFNIEPGNSFIGGGFQAPVNSDLKLIRDDLDFDPGPFRKILKNNTFTATFGTLQGEQLKTAPQGYRIDNASIDLLRYKQFLLKKNFTDDEVLSPSFLKTANQTYLAMRPFLDYMSSVLSADSNGFNI